MTPRNRMLLLVLGFTTLAALGVHQPWRGDAQARTLAQVAPVFPGLGDTRDSLVRIEIESGEKSVSLLRGEKGWVVKERFGHSADAGRLSGLLDGLEDLDTRDLVAERRESHALYGVGEGQGTRVRLFGPEGALVGEIVGGKIRGQNIQDLRRFSMAFYFRRGDEDAVYLTPSFFSPSADPSSWVAGRLFEALDAEAIDRMERLDATGKDSWSLVRLPQPAESEGEDDLAPDASVWAFERPTDRGSVDSSKASSLAWTLTGFGIKDVLGKCDPQKGPGSAFGFPSDVFLAGAGEDSLELRWGVSAEKEGGRPLWIPGQPWIYELAKFDVDRILASVEDLLPPLPQVEEETPSGEKE